MRAYSAGGVVFREVPTAVSAGQMAIKDHEDATRGDHLLDLVEVVLVGRSHSGMWALPKGTPRSGETIEQVAVREVQEETGLQVKLITYIGTASYSFIRNQVRYFKQVRHFLFEAIGGDIALHDAEYDRVAWYPLAEALRLMTYPNEANILSQAESILLRLVQRRYREGQV